MGVRNCKDLGENLQKVVRRLMANENLVKLLYYTDQDPLSQSDLTDDQKRNEIFNKLIKMVPRLDPKEDGKSVVSVTIARGTKIGDNNEFKQVFLVVEVFVPLTQWIIKGTNLRPFAILGEVQESLDNKTINGLGKMAGGDFEFNFVSDEMGSYRQFFELISYE